MKTNSKKTMKSCNKFSCCKLNYFKTKCGLNDIGVCTGDSQCENGLRCGVGN